MDRYRVWCVIGMSREASLRVRSARASAGSGAGRFELAGASKVTASHPKCLVTSAQDTLATVVRHHKPATINVALKFTKKDQNIVLRALSLFSEADPNGHATGFLVGDAMSYLSSSAKRVTAAIGLLPFKQEFAVVLTVNHALRMSGLHVRCAC